MRNSRSGHHYLKKEYFKFILRFHKISLLVVCKFEKRKCLALSECKLFRYIKFVVTYFCYPFSNQGCCIRKFLDSVSLVVSIVQQCNGSPLQIPSVFFNDLCYYHQKSLFLTVVVFNTRVLTGTCNYCFNKKATQYFYLLIITKWNKIRSTLTIFYNLIYKTTESTNFKHTIGKNKIKP